MRGDDGDNYTDTVFDDEAATSIAVGDRALHGLLQAGDGRSSAADGIDAAGAWRLKAVDVGADRLRDARWLGR